MFRTRKLRGEIDEELAFHIAERTDDLVAAGMSQREAQRESIRRLGNYELQKESTLDMDVARRLEAAVADLRYALRQLRQSPAFAGVAVLSLAIGIGANTAIFQLINAFRLRPLPVSEPSRLAALDGEKDFFAMGWYSARNTAFTYPQFDYIRTHQRAFSDVAAFGTTRFDLSKGGESRYAEALYISANFLRLLGVTPLLGRDFAAGDPRACGDAAVILSYSFWQREFGGSAAAMGREISLDGHNFPVIGITARSFFGVEPGRQFDVAVPLCSDTLLAPEERARRMDRRDAWWLTIIGRLEPGQTVESASAHLRALSPAIFRDTMPERYRPDAAKKYAANKLRVVSAAAGVSDLRESYSNPLWILLGTTGLVLLIACANLANLLLARASAREHDIAVRQALGASKARLIGQFLSESVLLAFLGAVLGGVIAQTLSQALVAFIDDGRDRIHFPPGIDWRVFSFLAVMALLTCVLFGLAPALRAASTPSATTMATRGTAASAERSGLRRALVVCQVALSFILLVGALLFGRSLRNLLTVDTGINPDGVLVATVDTKLPRLQPERRRLIYRQLQERVGAEPGVVSAAAIWLSPFSGSGWNQDVEAEGKGANGKKIVWMNRISPGYFRTMQTPLLAGRDFDRHDDLTGPRVAIVNQVFAKELLNGQNPVGRTFRVEGPAGKADDVYQIVGLVGNTKYNGLREEFRPIAFFPFDQDPETPDAMHLMVRSRGPMNNVTAAVRRQISELNPELLVEFRMLDLDVRQSVLRERIMANLSGGFGVLAALLSALGLYGVMSYTVARRRNEIGVRVAMGADWRDILGLVFKEAGRLVLVGLAIGLVCSYALSRYAESLLFGLKPNDALTLALASASLAVTAVLATLIPARRAVRVDPVVALRQE